MLGHTYALTDDSLKTFLDLMNQTVYGDLIVTGSQAPSFPVHLIQLSEPSVQCDFYSAFSTPSHSLSCTCE